MADWVSKGRGYLRDGSSLCPFCQQKTITEEFRQDLESYFDREYALGVENVANIRGRYEKFAKYFDDLFLLIGEKLQVLHLKELPLLPANSTKIELDKKMRYNIEVMTYKGNSPSQKVSLEITEDEVKSIRNLIKEVNNGVVKYNRMIENTEGEIEKLSSDAWKFVIHENWEAISDYLKDKYKYEDSLKNAELKLVKCEDKEAGLNIALKNAMKDRLGTQSSIDNINSFLKKGGFSSFQIVPCSDQKNYYQIQRDDNTNAEATLSEGEMTFIAFLYFWQQVGGDFEKEEVGALKIVVIDDPVSILDTSVLFFISTLIRNLIDDIKDGNGNVKQFILLTHDVYFYKEVFL